MANYTFTIDDMLVYKYPLKNYNGNLTILLFKIDTDILNADDTFQLIGDNHFFYEDLDVWSSSAYMPEGSYTTVPSRVFLYEYEDDNIVFTRQGVTEEDELMVWLKDSTGKAIESSKNYANLIFEPNYHDPKPGLYSMIVTGVITNKGLVYAAGDNQAVRQVQTYNNYGIDSYTTPIFKQSKGHAAAYWEYIAAITFPTPTKKDANETLARMVSASTLYDRNDPNPGDGDSHGGGGGGTDDLGGDTIEDTGVPTIEATDSGLMTLYNPTVGELQALGRFLWSDGLDLNSFKKLFNDPFDTLLGLSIIPIVPPTSGTKKIMFGNLDSGVTAKIISHQFVPNVDMGTVTLGEVYNGALDYSPFTTVSIYLPFIGYRELNVQDIMNSKIHLVYKFDVLTGGCIAELYVDHLKTGNKCKDNSKFKWGAHSGLLASFEGQCAVNIPLASQDYTNTIRAMIGAVGMVGGAAASFATGNPALGVAALAVGSANASIQASTPTVQRSGHLSSSNAIMANLTPFLTVTRPHQCKPANYYKLRGVPSQIYVSKLSSLVTSKHNYYLQVAEIPDIKVAGATDTEIAEIKNLLKEGVVL